MGAMPAAPPPVRTAPGPSAPTASVAPLELDEPAQDLQQGTQRPWVVLVWNDPVNLMSYVTHVFREYFGYSEEKATALMLDVHHKGRAAVASCPREEAERHVAALQEYGLWATMRKDD